MPGARSATVSLPRGCGSRLIAAALVKIRIRDEGQRADPRHNKTLCAGSAVTIDAAVIEPEPMDHESAAADPLGFEVGRLRTLGHRIVDLVADHWAELDTLPVVRTASPDAPSGLGGPVPREPGSAEEAIALLADDALIHMQHAAHPRYFARVPSPTSYTGILGDWLGVGFNAIAASWAGGSGPTQLELTVVDWLRELLGFPAGTDRPRGYEAPDRFAKAREGSACVEFGVPSPSLGASPSLPSRCPVSRRRRRRPGPRQR